MSVAVRQGLKQLAPWNESRGRDRHVRYPEPPHGANVGLLLDRLLQERDDNNETLKALYGWAADMAPSPLYRQAYDRWHSTLRALAVPCSAVGWATCSTRHPDAPEAVHGRLIVGLGAESVRETSIALHRVWGVPTIPGSALKGLARRYLERHLPAVTPDEQAQKCAYREVLFGSTAKAGHVTFFDAWYVPGSAPDDRPLALDTITVHHPRYYNATDGKRREPWDFDDPTPIAFLSARGSFLVSVRGPDEAWTTAALKLLSTALEDWGVGAKTSSGYGRLYETADARVVGSSDAATPTEGSTVPASGSARPAALQLPDHPLTVQVRALRQNQIRPQIRGLFDQWRRLPADEPARRQVADAIAARLTEARMWESPLAWVLDLRAYLDEPGGD